MKELNVGEPNSLVFRCINTLLLHLSWVVDVIFNLVSRCLIHPKFITKIVSLFAILRYKGMLFTDFPIYA